MSSRARALRWLAPSIVGALGATAVAALADAARYVERDAGEPVEGAVRIAVAAGYGVLVAAPIALALALIGRAVAWAWQPRALVVRMTDERGAAPRLAGWILGAIAGLGLLALFANQLVWIFARATAFKPRTLAVLWPVGMVLIAIAVVLVTGAIARGLGDGLAAIERRRARPLLTPRRIGIAAAIVLAAALAAAWFAAVRPLVRQLAVDGLEFAALALVLLVVVHVAWPRVRARGRRATIAAVTASAIAAGALAGAAVWARWSRPSLVLSLWGGDGFDALALDVALDIDRVRADLPAAALAPRARPGAPRRDIVLLTLDTFRPDRLAAYGGPVPAPSLAALAARGTVFELALAPANVTRRSIPAIVTGLAPTRIRGRVAGWALRMDPRHITIAERLRAAGYDTIGLFCCEGFWNRKRPTGLERGFTDMVVEHDAEIQVAAAAARLAARPPDAPPLYMWLHFIELHEWANGDPDMRPERRRLYDDALTALDVTVGKLVAALDALPPERRPIVIVTGDHSEALGDHGAPFHSSDLYNSQIQVPLIIAGPGVVAGRVGEAVSLIDLVPTTLELAGFEAPGHPILDGRSLVDLLTGARASDPERGRAYAAMLVDRFVRTGLRALVVGRWKLIQHAGGRSELYDLRSDPRELVDRAAREPDHLRRMRGELFLQRARDRASPFPR